MTELTSNDGTAIAYDRTGDGPALVIVAGAMSDRNRNAALAGLLAADFTVFNYDRRGRGESGDTAPYAAEREIEDLAAIIAASGDSPVVFGDSSGGNLALRSALTGLELKGLALWEPNFVVDDSRPPLPDDYVEHLNELVSSDRRGDAVEYFMTTAAGMPAEFVAPMRQAPFWPAQEALAHTLAYDGEVVDGSMSGKPLSADDWASVAMPALILDGGTVPWMTSGADALAEALPNAERRTLEGQMHDVAPEPLAQALIEVFRGR